VDALVLGLAIGLAAGLSPGPLLVLVVTESLRSGWRAGVLTAASPLLSDVVVVAGVLLLLQQLPSRTLPLLGVIGGVYIVWSAVSTWREASVELSGEETSMPLRAALRRAFVVNILSPHPWVTWATVLGPLIIRTWQESQVSGVALIAGFYCTLVGAKAVLAVIAARGRGLLAGGWYQRALRVAAVLLAVAGIALIVEFAPVALQR
jgi:threonine/homoserine/homoserine lactone efflux protein